MKLLGVRASITELVLDIDRIRLRVAIENTGERGKVVLTMDNCRLYVFDRTQADSWAQRYSWSNATDRVGEDLRGFKNILTLHADDPQQFPVTLEKGERWEGWVGTLDRRLPPTAVGILAMLGALVPDKLAIPAVFYTCTPATPLVMVRGEIKATPLSAPARRRAWLSKHFRIATYCFLPFGGALLGMLAFSTLLGEISGPMYLLGWFGGAFVGYQIGSSILRHIIVKKMPFGIL
jgi:hypothetical protein